MEWIEAIPDIIMAFSSVWIVNKFADNAFEKKASGRFLTGIIWILFILVQVFAEMDKGNVSVQKATVSFLLILGMVAAGYKGALRRKVLFVSLFVAIWILAEFFVCFILNLCDINEGTKVWAGTILSKALLVILLVCVILKRIPKETDGLERKLWMILFFISVESAFMAFAFYELCKGRYQFWGLSFYVLLLMMNVEIFEIYNKLIERAELEKANAVYEKQADMLKNYIQEQAERGRAFRREQHDFHNKLLSIRKSIMNDERKKALRQIDGILGQDFAERKQKIAGSGNDIIDTMLQFKCAKAKLHGIEVRADAFAMQELPVSDEDLCIILGNMFDNAIEACEKVSERWIRISVGFRKNGLVVVVENPFDGVLKRDARGNILSAKADSEHHGYGLLSIEKTVKKYDGEFVTEIRGNIFRAVAFIVLAGF